MPPKSKYALGEYSKNANKVFTNRESLIGFFNASRNSLQKEKHSLLTFYGVGGEGKSALCKKFIETLKEEKPQTAALGLVDFEAQTLRRADRALLELRKSLRISSNGKIKFPAFEIAITHYWEKEYPELNVRDSLRDIFDKNIDTTASIADNLKDWTQYAKDLPASLADNLKDWAQYAQELPAGVGLGLKFLNYLRHKSQDAYYKRAKESLKDLEKLQNHELLRKLPYIFASDILAYTEQEKSLNVILCLDTYEALWEHSEVKKGIGAAEADCWVRDLACELHGVLFIMMGREKITWDKDFPDQWAGYLDNQHQLHGLKDEDADRFLRLIPIHLDSIRTAIIQGSKGEANNQLSPEQNRAHPFFLELAADLYLGLLDEGKLAEAEDIGKTPREVLERFLKYRSKDEIETLRVLSVAHSFDQVLFESLVTYFKTSYPLTAFSDFISYSFIQLGQDGRYYIHALMRDHLSSTFDPATLLTIKDYLFNYYSNLLPETSKFVNSEHEFSLQQAFRYLNWENLEKAYRWYDNQIILFHQAAKYSLLIPIAFNILHYLNKNLPAQKILIAEINDHLGRLHEKLGKYSDAEPLYDEALRILKGYVDHVEASDRSFAHLGSAYNNLGRLYEYLDRDSEALSLYTDALALFKSKAPNFTQGIASILNNIAEIYNKNRILELAEPLYKESLVLYRQDRPADDPNVASVLNNLATLYRRKERYAESERMHQQSLAIREKCLQPNHPEIANSLHNLAALYIVMYRLPEARALLQRAISIRRSSLPADHPDLIESLNCLKIIDSKSR